ncbi:hypothetical protein [Prauserella shujinwangii]|uniref:hypothetical protein n=1 Tax=Prauserella shujinwangii TaxID=1453103 RepID=UPI0011B24789|nr:hypothetical protein [Prauserella shujinwangii]
MKLRELDELILQVITESDHPEITRVEVVPTEEDPTDHTRVVVHFASGASAVIMIRDVRGSRVRTTTPFELPKEALV